MCPFDSYLRQNIYCTLKMRNNPHILPLLLLAVLLKLSSSQNCTSGLNYRHFEKSILTESNVKVLEEHFYPINSHRKDIVNITYIIILPENKNISLKYGNESICFHWLYSPVHLYINHVILQGLSLQTYVPEISNATLIVDLTEFCPDDLATIYNDFNTITKLKDKDKKISELCHNNSILILSLLNNFTANAHMYALGQKMRYDEEVHPNDRGYSVYYYYPNKASKYCVMNYEDNYRKQRYILNFGSLAIIVFAVLGFPPLLVQFQEKIKEVKQEYWKLITLSGLIVTSLVTLLVIVNDMFLLIQSAHHYDAHSTDILTLYCVFFFFFFSVWFVDLIGIKLALGRSNRNNDAGCDPKKCCSRETCIIVILCTILVYFFQLMSFHMVYIVLGAIASPSETLSILCSFITAYVFTVIYVAVFIQYLLKKTENKCLHYSCSTIFFISGLALVGGIALFTAYFYRFPIVMDMTDRNEGLWGVVKSFLPLLFVSILGFGGHKLLKLTDTKTNGGSAGNGNIQNKKPPEAKQLIEK